MEEDKETKPIFDGNIWKHVGYSPQRKSRSGKKVAIINHKTSEQEKLRQRQD